MELSWDSVFTSPAGTMYVVHVGTSDKAANLVTGKTLLFCCRQMLKHYEKLCLASSLHFFPGDKSYVTHITISSSLWKSPGECFISVVAVAPSGENEAFHQLIFY